MGALTPLLSCDAYRKAIACGLVVSAGGITEYTAKDARRTLLKYMQGADTQQAEDVCNEFLHVFDRVGTGDVDAEGKRLLVPLLTTVGFLLAQGCFPPALSAPLFERVFAAVRKSKDVHRLRAAIAVFIGLFGCRVGGVRRRSLGMLLRFLGFHIPIVRQATAKALYIRLLEEQGDLDLATGDATGESTEATNSDSTTVAASSVTEVLELLSVTAWGTDDQVALTSALREVYIKLRFELPSDGRLLIVPRKPERKPQQVEYAELVKENHY